MKIDFKKVLPHLAAIAIFVVINLIYFQPVTEGYKLSQGDNIQFKGTSAEIWDFREKYGDEPLWTNTVFGGMPAGLISVIYKNNYMNYIERAFELWLPHPVNIVFICMLGFYILFICLRVNPWLAIAGGIAFGFSTYNFLIIEAGHNTKALAMAWMAPALGAVIYTYRNPKVIWGAAITALFFALEFRCNHLQVTYYLFMVLFFFGIFEFIRFMQNGELKKFFVRSAVIVFAIGIGVLPNYSMLKTIAEIAGETTRSESGLTVKADGKSNKEDKTSGLDRSYIVDYSYGKQESINLLIPNALGGGYNAIGNDEELMSQIEDPRVAQEIMNKPTYWGEQSTSGPTYLGVVVLTLFVLSFLFIKDITKWGFLLIAIIALMLAWGKNLQGFTDFFIDYVPGYNKFRAVTIILCIVMMIAPFLGLWGVHHLVKRQEEFKNNIRKFYLAAAAIGFMLILLFIAGNSFDFLNSREKAEFADASMKAGSNMAMVEFNKQVKDALIDARSSLYTSDLFRAFAFVIATLLVVFLFIRGVFNQYLMYGSIALLILIDMWSVDVRFLNNDTYPDSEEYISWVLPLNQEMPHYASPADYVIFKAETSKQPSLIPSILQMEKEYQQRKEAAGDENTSLTLQESDHIRFRELNFATNYRVLNFYNPFNDGRTSYFHKSIGGYHGAKQKRTQEIIEFHYSNEIAMLGQSLNSGDSKKIIEAMKSCRILNMMNTRYISLMNPDPRKWRPTDTGRFIINEDTVIPPRAVPTVIVNNLANGNAWFVNEIKEVNNDDEEIREIGKVDLKKVAVISKSMKSAINAKPGNGNGKIELKSYRPNKMVYEFTSEGDNLAVFSEVHTSNGWTAKIDGKETPIARVNYFVRGVMVPNGTHTLTMEYDLNGYRSGEKISLAGSILVILLVLYALYKTFLSKTPEEKAEVIKAEVID